METQHIKYTENIFGKPNNYMWLCSKKPHMVYWMSTKDEIKIRNCLNKVSQCPKLTKKLFLKFYIEADHSRPRNQSVKTGAHLSGPKSRGRS